MSHECPRTRSSEKVSKQDKKTAGRRNNVMRAVIIGPREPNKGQKPKCDEIDGTIEFFPSDSLDGFASG